MRAEIRCCCNAGKLLGTVEVSGNGGDYVTWIIDGKELKLPWGIAQFPSGLPERGWRVRALKSMDTPMETLMKIPGFVPEE